MSVLCLFTHWLRLGSKRFDRVW